MVNIEITIIQTIIFELKHGVFIQHVSLKEQIVTENFEILPYQNTQNAQKENVQI